MFASKLIKLVKIALSPRFLLALMKGAAAGVEHKKILQKIKPGCIVDVGANRGQFALIARDVFPATPIYSFEPLQEPAEIFNRVFKKDAITHLFTCAIGKEQTVATIHITREDDSSSLLPVMEMQSRLFPGSAERSTREIQVMPLATALGKTVLPPDSLLKVDVQGYELHVLQGSEELLDAFSYLYIECSFIELYQGQALAREVIDWVAKRGFVLQGTYNTFCDANGQAVQADFLFVRSDINSPTE